MKSTPLPPLRLHSSGYNRNDVAPAAASTGLKLQADKCALHLLLNKSTELSFCFLLRCLCVCAHHQYVLIAALSSQVPLRLFPLRRRSAFRYCSSPFHFLVSKQTASSYPPLTPPPPSTELDDPSAKAYVSSPRFPFFSLSLPSAALPLSPKPHVVNSCSARPPSAAFQITKETRCVYRLLCRILFAQRPHCRRLACRCTL
jgi:hypothetical protein